MTVTEYGPDRPLHVRYDLPKYACQRPEEPWHRGIRYDFRCRNCTLHALVALRNQGDVVLRVRHVGTQVVRVALMSEMVAEYGPLHGLPDR